jgi:hypothetical protein
MTGTALANSVLSFWSSNDTANIRVKIGADGKFKFGALNPKVGQIYYFTADGEDNQNQTNASSDQVKVTVTSGGSPKKPEDEDKNLKDLLNRSKLTDSKAGLRNFESNIKGETPAKKEFDKLVNGTSRPFNASNGGNGRVGNL